MQCDGLLRIPREPRQIRFRVRKGVRALECRTQRSPSPLSDLPAKSSKVVKVKFYNTPPPPAAEKRCPSTDAFGATLTGIVSHNISKDYIANLAKHVFEVLPRRLPRQVTNKAPLPCSPHQRDQGHQRQADSTNLQHTTNRLTKCTQQDQGARLANKRATLKPSVLRPGALTDAHDGILLPPFQVRHTGGSIVCADGRPLSHWGRRVGFGSAASKGGFPRQERLSDGLVSSSASAGRDSGGVPTPKASTRI